MDNLKEIETEINKKFKELETSISQVLGLVDPHFQRVIGNLMSRYRDDVINIINNKDSVEGKK